ncbi:MAG: prepilin-type N-terminal cleavage/methylation domain-containing protein [Elusimicrobiota bacterium]|jgi:prepilin-type N-terminal cleavage/methylation domain-containing protein|nr:prepilin-type N-terminal cleavage/methylation domain-containing protein [Elusimicrobiota bacterium]
MKNNKGFTRIELIVVIAILAILAVVAVPIYKNYIKDYLLSEGKALMSSIQTAEKIYYAEFGVFYEISEPVDYDETLNIDARKNDIFKKFSVKVSNDISPKTYEITVIGEKNLKEIVLNINGVESSDIMEVSTK